MEIAWYGHSCFRISDRGRVAIVTDPYSESIGLPELKLKADIVSVSQDHEAHNHVDAVKGDPRILYGPGEYEIGGVFVMGFPMHNITEEHAQANVAYLFDYGNLNVLHLGGLARVPEQSEIEDLGQVNVLILPVGGEGTLNASQAADVVALIEPHFIIPMQYALPNLAINRDPVDRFLTAMGISHVNETDILKITPADLPEQPQVVILNVQS